MVNHIVMWNFKEEVEEFFNAGSGRRSSSEDG